MSDRTYLIDVRDGVKVLDPSVGADTMAVLGAMMSRAPDLAVRYDQLVEHMGAQDFDLSDPPKKVQNFLQKYLGEYNHASIGSMAKAMWIYLYGFGWPEAWLLEDFPLFDGQEVSTRAVDSAEIPGRQGPGTPCLMAPEEFDSLHQAWMKLFNEAKDEDPSGYAFDEVRGLLPGTTPSGVVLTQDVRAVARHFDRIHALGGVYEELADRGYSGLERLAPETTRAVAHKDRAIPAHWRLDTNYQNIPEQMQAQEGMWVEAWGNPDPTRWKMVAEGLEPRKEARSYLDPGWKRAPRFRVRLTCSVAVARDWHRHRPPMPWQLSVVVDEGGDPVLAPWYGCHQTVPGQLWQKTCEAFGSWMEQASHNPDAGWRALHALPFGSLVQLHSVCTLPELVYMLELRATAPGANPEYRNQARAGIEQLCEIVPQEIVERESLDGALEA